jgi:hypothetical protein
MKTYIVDVHFDVAHSHEVQANSPEEAEDIIIKKIERGEITYLSDGYHDAEGTEVTAAGEVDDNGEHRYY